MAGSDDEPIVQLELLDDNKFGIIFCILACDGSGPLRPSLLNMLILEDTIATSHELCGFCHSKVSVKIYHQVSKEEALKKQFARALPSSVQLA